MTWVFQIPHIASWKILKGKETIPKRFGENGIPTL